MKNAEFTATQFEDDLLVGVRPTARIKRASVGILLVSISSVYLPLYAYRSLASTTWKHNLYMGFAYAFLFLSMGGLRLVYGEVSSRQTVFSRRAIGIERRIFALGTGMTWYSTSSMTDFGLHWLGEDLSDCALLFVHRNKNIVVLIAPIERSRASTLIATLRELGLDYPSTSDDDE